MRLIYLTDKFYTDYAECKEILRKKTRPYACIEIEIDGLTFAIPFRHNIEHKYAFRTVGKAGLDYSKAVIITKPEYISAQAAVIDSKEFARIKGKEQRLINDMRKYYRLYLKAAADVGNRHYDNIRRYSALQYFL